MPTRHTKRDTLFEIVEAAVAPSADRPRGWSVALDPEEVRRFADRARELAVSDPDDRELTIGCGAALYDLRLVSGLRGLETRVDTGAAAGTAQVEVRPSSVAADHRLADAIDLRRTGRQGFRDEPVPHFLAERLAAVVAEEGATAVVAGDALRARIAELVAHGDHLRFAVRRWRRGLASLTHPRRTPDRAARPDASVPTGPTVASAPDIAARAARHDGALAMSAPLLMVVATPGDTSADWLKAGEGLEHLLLEAADAGLQVSFLNQPCRTPQLRERLRADLPGGRFPQVIVRIGFPDGAASHQPGA